MRKKYHFLGLIMALAIFTVFTNAYAFDPSLIAAWTFEEGSGGTTVDITGKGHDGTVFGEPKWTGVTNGKGLSIMDVEQYVRVADSDDLHFEDNDFTFTAWISIDNFDAPLPLCILSKRSLAEKNACPSLMWVVGDGANQLELQMRDDSAGLNSLTAKTQLKAKVWYHVAVVKDPKNVTFYINGVEDGKLPHGFDGSFTSYQPLFIGVHHWGIFEPIVWDSTLTGIIDEVGVFNKALTSEEIKNLMPNLLAVEASGKMATSWGHIKSDSASF